MLSQECITSQSSVGIEFCCYYLKYTIINATSVTAMCRYVCMYVVVLLSGVISISNYHLKMIVVVAVYGASLRELL